MCSSCFETLALNSLSLQPNFPIFRSLLDESPCSSEISSDEDDNDDDDDNELTGEQSGVSDSELRIKEIKLVRFDWK